MAYEIIVFTVNNVAGSPNANNTDPDQTVPMEQSDQGLYCLPFNWLFVMLCRQLKFGIKDCFLRCLIVL